MTSDLEALLASHLFTRRSIGREMLLRRRKASLYDFHCLTFALRLLLLLLLWVKVRNECLVLGHLSMYRGICELLFELRVMKALPRTNRVEGSWVSAEWVLEVGQLSAERPPTVRVRPGPARHRASSWHLVEKVCP